MFVNKRIMSQFWRQLRQIDLRFLHNGAAVRNVAKPRAQYGGRHTVTLLPGDGVGPELMEHVKHVFKVAAAPIDFEEIALHRDAPESVYDYALLAIKRNGVALKGNFGSSFDRPRYISRNVELRTHLDLFANVVWCRSVSGVPTRHQDIDLVIIRENTEGEYSSLEHEIHYESVGGVVESLKIITAYKSTRLAKYAFDFAVKHNRQKVTAVHKANIMKLGDGLFLECCQNVAKDYPQIKFESMIVDNCSMQMVSKPQQFDVLVLPNLFGNIITNIGAGLVGGAGIVPGMNIGEKYAVFETGTRNTGQNIAGKNIANPAAILLASADMLDYLGLEEQSKLIHQAVFSVLANDKIHTPDIGGTSSTIDMVNAVINTIAETKGNV